MAAVSNLAVVICHGCYHSPEPYMPLVKALNSRGFDAHCPQLPTADLTKLNVGDVHQPDFDREPPEAGYPQGEQDKEIVVDVLKHLINEQGKNVLLVGHSAGGWVATEAALPEFQLKSRQEKGLFGARKKVPVVPPFMEFHQPNNFAKKHGAAGLGTIASSLTASPILTSKLTNNAYSEYPCAYLVLEADLTLPKDQKSGSFTIYRCPAGHSPHLSWTEGVIDTIGEFVKTIGFLNDLPIKAI
ncbi:uncharacterized protein BDR25DRAFT_329414 [Lindgomyces ingoldianus]|uniref:Uncharacterized protein n=1 Tax=Lindgomyces ingoldianus TaxID=673940 RepID=A0ACB6QAM0_9PLEO|nr:uncharacterized protein BDR25DRAFT_329414 [Lindgomyces ingoldianus]KAF2463952.1 hypothetical protein BDR25DRAFT_329414 [Lindgomyces ingoldianus]